MPNLATILHPKWLHPKWLRPPLVPLVYLLAIALPLSIWQSPGTYPQATAIFAASIALLILTAIPTGWAQRLWPWVYFALGIGMVLIRSRFHANELAGVMLLFVPLATILALCRGLSPVRRLQTGLLALLFGGALFATGSRGGIMALLAAGTVALILERRWRSLSIGLLLAGALTAAGATDWLVYDGKVQGLTIDSLLTGRPEIWQHSLHAVTDFSWTGIGIGTFPEIVPALYYPSGLRYLEDAHNLALQTALDLGVCGLLAMAMIVWLAFRQTWSAWRRAPAETSKRAWALGLLATLLAFGVFNIFDAIALGTPGSLAFFVLLGLTYALPKPRRRRGRWRIPARGRWRLLVGAAFMLLGLSSVRGARQLNQAAVLGARAIVHDAELLPSAHDALVAAGRGTCHAAWLEGKVAQAWNRPPLRDAAWSKALRCSATFVPLVADELPEHQFLAESAVELHPSSAAAYLWLARLRLRSRDRDDAKRLYRRVLELDPTNGAAWLELGRLLEPEDSRAALNAYAKSCQYGDPGANGCQAAGNLAEQLEDIETAIHYYRRSRLPSAERQADRLENREGAQALE